VGAPNVGFATLSIIPSARGAASALNRQLAGPAAAAGITAGKGAGKGILGGVTTHAKKAAVTMGLVFGGAAIIGGIKNTVTAAAGLETKFREVVTLFGETGPIADKTFGKVRGDVRKLSDEFGIAQETLVGGLYQAISAGVPRENAFTFMQVASKAAVGGVTDVETAVDGISTVINAFGLSAKDAEKVSDSLFTAVKGGKTNFAQLAGSLFNVAPAAAAAGVSFQEVNAAIATLTAGGTPTSVATTQIRAALTGLQRPSKDLDKIFGKLGFKTAEQAIKQKGLGFALKAVRDAADGSAGRLQTLLGSTEAVSAANVLAGTGAEKFAAEMKNQAKAAGATSDAFGEVNKSAERQFKLFTNKLRNIGVSLGAALLPVLVTVSDFLSKNLGPALATVGKALATAGRAFAAMAGFVSDNQGPLLAVASVITAVMVPAMIRAGVVALMSAGQQATAWLIAQASAVRAAVVSSVQTGIMAARWVFLGGHAIAHAARVVAGWALTGVAAAAQAAVHALHVGVMVAKWAFLGVQSLLHAAKVALAWLIAMGPIALVIAAVIGLVVVVVKNWDKIKRAIVAAATATLNFLRRNWPLILAILTGPIGLAVLAIVRNWDRITAGARKMKDGAVRILRQLVSFVQSIPGRILRALGNLGGLLLESGRDIVRGLIEGIRSMGGAIRDVLVGLLPGPLRKFASKLGLASPSKLFRGYGQDTIKGFILGIRDMQQDTGRALVGAVDLPRQPRIAGPAARRPVTSEAASLASAGDAAGLRELIGEIRGMRRQMGRQAVYLDGRLVGALSREAGRAASSRVRAG